MQFIHWHELKSHYGKLLIGDLNEQFVCISDWNYPKRWELAQKRILKHCQVEFVNRETQLIKRTKVELEEYFEGKRQIFTLPLKHIGSSFQKEVWHELQKIPYGQVISYMELSKRLGKEKAIRAVASANGANILSILIPCHRVIGKNNQLTGYAGGLHTKKKLLQLEGSWPQIDQLKLFNDELSNAHIS